MQQRTPVDAIFFCNDDLAQGALMAALRLEIAGLIDLPGSDQMLPQLTTVRTPRAWRSAFSTEALMNLQTIPVDAP